jgi:hypothetical protein
VNNLNNLNVQQQNQIEIVDENPALLPEVGNPGNLHNKFNTQIDKSSDLNNEKEKSENEISLIDIDQEKSINIDPSLNKIYSETYHNNSLANNFVLSDNDFIGDLHLFTTSGILPSLNKRGII